MKRNILIVAVSLFSVTALYAEQKSTNDGTFISTYDQKVEEGSAIVADKFGPPSCLSWAQLYQGAWSKERLNIENTGKNAMKVSLVNSFRETVVERSSLAEWQVAGNDFFADLFTGSVGNTFEEETDLTSTKASVIEKVWRQRALQEGPFQYGVRPLRTKPEAYISANIKNRSGRLIALIDLRCYYKISGARRVEGKILVPITRHWQADAGVFFDPLDMNNRGSRIASAKVEKVFFDPNNFLSTCFLGASSSGRGGSIVLGISKRFH